MLNLPAPTLTAPHHSSTSRLQQQQNPREKPSAAPSLFPSSITLTPDFLVQCAEGTAVGRSSLLTHGRPPEASQASLSLPPPLPAPIHSEASPRTQAPRRRFPQRGYFQAGPRNAALSPFVAAVPARARKTLTQDGRLPRIVQSEDQDPHFLAPHQRGKQLPEEHPHRSAEQGRPRGTSIDDTGYRNWSGKNTVALQIN